jgi:hypothetical protein
VKALTICQPYAELIARGDKRIENRTWPTMYRGPLLIHAGKSREWIDFGYDGNGRQIDDEYLIPIDEMHFGFVVATAKLSNCVKVEAIHDGKYDDIYPWAKTHEHANGPWCFVLDEVKRLPKPIQYRGAQGLFEIPDDLVLP